MPRALQWTLPLLALTLATPSAAWAPETRVRMVDEAVRLLPESLRQALTAHRRDLLIGMLEPMTAEDGPEHRPPWSEGTLDRRIEGAAHDLIESLGVQTSFKSIARQFGTLAHFVSDAGFPPGAGGPDGASRYAHFASFCESRSPKFPLVFYGHDNEDLARGNFRAFALAVMKRARSEDAELERTYSIAGTPPNPALFDDRSVPFAVASLSYSRGVTEIVQAWLAVWTATDGDMGRTPYWGMSEKQSGVEEIPRRP